jgi:hypothetical protein
MDLSAFSDEDLQALKENDITKVSDEGLTLLKNAADPSIPTPMSNKVELPSVERDLSLRQKSVNLASQYMKRDPIGDLFNKVFYGKEFPDYGERDAQSAPYPKITPSKEKLAQEASLYNLKGITKSAKNIAEVPLKIGSELLNLGVAGTQTGLDFLGVPTVGTGSDVSFGKVDVPFIDRLQQDKFYKYDPSKKGAEYYKTVTENLGALPATSQFSNLSRMSGIQKVAKKDMRGATATDKLNEEIQKFVNKPYAEQLTEFNQNLKFNKIAKDSTDAGYKLIPSSVKGAPLKDRIKESTIGSSKITERAQEANQKVTNNLIREYLGIDKKTPLDNKLLEVIRKRNGKIYAEVDELPAPPPIVRKKDPTFDTGVKYEDGSPVLIRGKNREDIVLKEYRNGAQILRDLMSTRKRAQAYWQSVKRNGRVEDRDAAKLLDSVVEKLEGELLRTAKYNKREDLIPKLKNARTEISKAHLVQKALNDVTGDVDAGVISKLAYERRLVEPSVTKVAKFYKGFPSLAKNPKFAEASPFSVLDVGLSAYGFGTGNALLSLPAALKMFSGRSLMKPNIQKGIVNSTITKPKPKGIRSLLQVPNVGLPRPSNVTLGSAGLASLLAPLDKGNQ